MTESQGCEVSPGGKAASTVSQHSSAGGDSDELGLEARSTDQRSNKSHMWMLTEGTPATNGDNNGSRRAGCKSSTSSSTEGTIGGSSSSSGSRSSEAGGSSDCEEAADGPAYLSCSGSDAESSDSSTAATFTRLVNLGRRLEKGQTPRDNDDVARVVSEQPVSRLGVSWTDRAGGSNDPGDSIGGERGSLILEGGEDGEADSNSVRCHASGPRPYYSAWMRQVRAQAVDSSEEERERGGGLGDTVGNEGEDEGRGSGTVLPDGTHVTHVAMADGGDAGEPAAQLPESDTSEDGAFLTRSTSDAPPLRACFSFRTRAAKQPANGIASHPADAAGTYHPADAAGASHLADTAGTYHNAGAAGATAVADATHTPFRLHRALTHIASLTRSNGTGAIASSGGGGDGATPVAIAAALPLPAPLSDLLSSPLDSLLPPSFADAPRRRALTFSSHSAKRLGASESVGRAMRLNVRSPLQAWYVEASRKLHCSSSAELKVMMKGGGEGDAASDQGSGSGEYSGSNCNNCSNSSTSTTLSTDCKHAGGNTAEQHGQLRQCGQESISAAQVGPGEKERQLSSAAIPALGLVRAAEGHGWSLKKGVTVRRQGGNRSGNVLEPPQQCFFVFFQQLLLDATLLALSNTDRSFSDASSEQGRGERVRRGESVRGFGGLALPHALEFVGKNSSLGAIAAAAGESAAAAASIAPTATGGAEGLRREGLVAGGRGESGEAGGRGERGEGYLVVSNRLAGILSQWAAIVMLHASEVEEARSAPPAVGAVAAAAATAAAPVDTTSASLASQSQSSLRFDCIDSQLAAISRAAASLCSSLLSLRPNRDSSTEMVSAACTAPIPTMLGRGFPDEVARKLHMCPRYILEAACGAFDRVMWEVETGETGRRCKEVKRGMAISSPADRGAAVTEEIAQAVVKPIERMLTVPTGEASGEATQTMNEGRGKAVADDDWRVEIEDCNDDDSSYSSDAEEDDDDVDCDHNARHAAQTVIQHADNAGTAGDGRGEDGGGRRQDEEEYLSAEEENRQDPSPRFSSLGSGAGNTQGARKGAIGGGGGAEEGVSRERPACAHTCSSSDAQIDAGDTKGHIERAREAEWKAMWGSYSLTSLTSLHDMQSGANHGMRRGASQQPMSRPATSAGRLTHTPSHSPSVTMDRPASLSARPRAPALQSMVSEGDAPPWENVKQEMKWDEMEGRRGDVDGEEGGSRRGGQDHIAVLALTGKRPARKSPSSPPPLTASTLPISLPSATSATSTTPVFSRTITSSRHSPEVSPAASAHAAVAAVPATTGVAVPYGSTRAIATGTTAAATAVATAPTAVATAATAVPTAATTHPSHLGLTPLDSEEVSFESASSDSLSNPTPSTCKVQLQTANWPAEVDDEGDGMDAFLLGQGCAEELWLATLAAANAATGTDERVASSTKLPPPADASADVAHLWSGHPGQQSSKGKRVQQREGKSRRGGEGRCRSDVPSAGLPALPGHEGAGGGDRQGCSSHATSGNGTTHGVPVHAPGGNRLSSTAHCQHPGMSHHLPGSFTTTSNNRQGHGCAVDATGNCAGPSSSSSPPRTHGSPLFGMPATSAALGKVQASDKNDAHAFLDFLRTSYHAHQQQQQQIQQMQQQQMQQQQQQQQQMQRLVSHQAREGQQVTSRSQPPPSRTLPPPLIPHIHSCPTGAAAANSPPLYAHPSVPPLSQSRSTTAYTHPSHEHLQLQGMLPHSDVSSASDVSGGNRESPLHPLCHEPSLDRLSASAMSAATSEAMRASAESELIAYLSDKERRWRGRSGRGNAGKGGAAACIPPWAGVRKSKDQSQAVSSWKKVRERVSSRGLMASRDSGGCDYGESDSDSDFFRASAGSGLGDKGGILYRPSEMTAVKRRSNKSSESCRSSSNIRSQDNREVERSASKKALGRCPEDACISSSGWSTGDRNNDRSLLPGNPSTAAAGPANGHMAASPSGNQQERQQWEDRQQQVRHRSNDGCRNMEQHMEGHMEQHGQQSSHYISSSPSTPSRYTAGSLLSPLSTALHPSPSSLVPPKAPAPAVATSFQVVRSTIPRSATVEVAGMARGTDAVTAADGLGCLSAPGTPDRGISGPAGTQQQQLHHHHDRTMMELQAGSIAGRASITTRSSPATSCSQTAVSMASSADSQAWSEKSTSWLQLRSQVLRSTTMEVPRHEGGATEGRGAGERQTGKQGRSGVHDGKVSCDPIGWRGGERESARHIGVVSEDEEEERESDGEEIEEVVKWRGEGGGTPEWVRKAMQQQEITHSSNGGVLQAQVAHSLRDGEATLEVEHRRNGNSKGKGGLHAMAMVARAVGGAAKRTMIRSK